MTECQDIYKQAKEHPEWVRVADEPRCDTCRHWKEWIPGGKEICYNESVDNMAVGYETSWFEPPADFHCKFWKEKE